MEELNEEMFLKMQELQKERYEKLYPDISVTYWNEKHVGKVPIKIGDSLYYTYEEYLFDKLLWKLAKTIIFLTTILILI